MNTNTNLKSVKKIKFYFYFFKIIFFISIFPIKIYAIENHIDSISFQINSLDEAWKNRETKQGQESILKFIKQVSEIPENFEVTWRISRLVYFIGNFGIGESLNNDEHIKIFELGYKAGEIAMNLNPKSVNGYYWYAINLGKYSLSVGLFTALRTASKARDALIKASQIDPSYHWAGPYRILGRYYQDLPSGISFGDKKKQRNIL